MSYRHLFFAKTICFDFANSTRVPNFFVHALAQEEGLSAFWRLTALCSSTISSSANL
tara:strand:- start:447 stop:617 length:171 start_codon:yes stop_codon:yes gene_type:complete